MMKPSRILLYVGVIALLLYTRSLAQGSLPHVLDTIAVGGVGGWDYVTCDTVGHRLFVSHESRVEVVDIVRRKKIGEIPNTPGIHGIAIAANANRGFTSNGKSASVTVFNLKTLEPETTIAVTGKKPDAILFEPGSNRVFTFNGGSSNCTAIDASSLEIVGTLDLGGAPESGVADGRGCIFVNLEDKNETVCFDATTLSISSRWPIAPAATPTGLAIDRTNRRLFIGGRNQILVVLDADNGKVLAHFPIGKGVDAVVFDPVDGSIFASNKDGTLDVFRGQSSKEFISVGKVTTLPGAKTQALDPKTHRVYLPATVTPGGDLVLLVVGN